MSSNDKKKSPDVLGFLEIGLDGDDGHDRVTNTDHFLIVGGSEQTHERMQELSIRFNESLAKRGKRLQETELAEIIDLFTEASDD